MSKAKYAVEEIRHALDTTTKELGGAVGSGLETVGDGRDAVAAGYGKGRRQVRATGRSARRTARKARRSIAAAVPDVPSAPQVRRRARERRLPLALAGLAAAGGALVALRRGR